MPKQAGFLLMAAMFALLAGCAATPEAVPEKPTVSAPERVAEINRLLAEERDGDRTAALLFERGHTWFEAAERKGTGWNVRGSARADYLTYVLNAIRDFETVVDRFPESPAAPDALFHLGVVHDYPNLSSFGLAMQYYRRTIDRYPGTEPADKALISIKNIEQVIEQMMQKGHGQGQEI